MKCKMCGRDVDITTIRSMNTDPSVSFDKEVKSFGTEIDVMKDKIFKRWGVVATTAFCVALIAFVGGDPVGEK